MIVHGVILSADYEPFEGTLLRTAGGDQVPWQMIFLPVAHLAYVSTMVWLHARLRLEGWLVARAGERSPAFVPAGGRPTP